MNDFWCHSESFTAYFCVIFRKIVKCSIRNNTNLELFCQNNTKLVKKLLISCEIGNLSEKDDQNGKKTAVLLRIW